MANADKQEQQIIKVEAEKIENYYSIYRLTSQDYKVTAISIDRRDLKNKRIDLDELTYNSIYLLYGYRDTEQYVYNKNKGGKQTMSQEERYRIMRTQVLEWFQEIVGFSNEQLLDYMNKNNLWETLDNRDLILGCIFAEEEHIIRLLGSGLTKEERHQITQ